VNATKEGARSNALCIARIDRSVAKRISRLVEALLEFSPHHEPVATKPTEPSKIEGEGALEQREEK
jgi:hypothetical protein